MPTTPRPLPTLPSAATTLPALWPHLPVETQAQVAWLLADLLRRVMPSRHAAMESSRAERRDRR
jgi:hypothetical protein